MNAEHARKLSRLAAGETLVVLRQNVEAAITSAAGEGRREAYYTFDTTLSKFEVNYIVSDLRDDGFNVFEQVNAGSSNPRIIIRW